MAAGVQNFIGVTSVLIKVKNLMIPIIIQRPGLLYLFMAITALSAPFVFSEQMELLRYVLILDLVATLFILIKRYIRNELILILYLIINYYIYAFPINHIMGMVSIDDVTIIQTLSARGLNFPADYMLYVITLIVFKNILMFTLSVGKSIGSVSCQRIGIMKPIEILSIGVLLAIFIIMKKTSGHAFFSIGIYFLIICLLIHYAMKLNSICKYNIFSAFAILIFLTYISFLITRSREPIAIVFLFFVFAYGKKYGPYSIKSLTLIIACFFLIVIYAALRSNGSFENLLSGGGIEALGESGTSQLVGSHLVGIDNREELPIELNEGFISKIKRLLPFLSKDKMLADKYTMLFYPEISAAGGGFGYPLVAELYIFGGLFAVVFVAFFIGKFIRWFLARFNSTIAYIAFLLVFVPLMRREISLLAITVISIGTIMFIIKSMSVLLVSSEDKK